jgi:outer membrane lipopolysaccharide assembly protein LptE/RlpB
MLRFLLTLLVTGCALVSAGCGYGFKSGQVREGLETVGVAFFENRSSEPDAEVALTEAVIRLLIEDRTLRIADEQVADAILYGTIRRYAFREAFFGENRQAEEYRVDIEVEVQMVDRRSGETIIGPERVKGTGSFFLEDGPEAEEQARLDAATMIVQGILNLVVEEW